MYVVCDVLIYFGPREIVLSIVCLSNVLSNVCLSIVCVSLGAPYVVGRSPDLREVRTDKKKPRSLLTQVFCLLEHAFELNVELFDNLFVLFVVI